MTLALDTVNPHVFIAGSLDDPRSGWAWCKTETGVVNRVAHYHDEIGWFHVGHVLEIISPEEVDEFHLSWGRKYRVAYALLRARYADDPETFCREILVPAMNRSALSKMKLNKPADVVEHLVKLLVDNNGRNSQQH